MKVSNDPVKRKVSIQLEIDYELLRMADHLGLNPSELLEESLTSLRSSNHIGNLKGVSLYTFRHLSDDFPHTTTGLRHCFRDK